MFGSTQHKPTSLVFTPLGWVRIPPCPRCNSRQYNLLDNNNWFHCWECRLVEEISKLPGLEIIK
jgi:hypothetical protein